VAPVLHLRPPCGGGLAPDADAWTLATSLRPHVAPHRCHCPACWVARHAPKPLRSSAPSREPATVAAILARSSGPSWGASTMATTLARSGGPSWRCPTHSPPLDQAGSPRRWLSPGRASPRRSGAARRARDWGRVGRGAPGCRPGAAPPGRAGTVRRALSAGQSWRYPHGSVRRAPPAELALSAWRHPRARRRGRGGADRRAQHRGRAGEPGRAQRRAELAPSAAPELDPSEARHRGRAVRYPPRPGWSRPTRAAPGNQDPSIHTSLPSEDAVDRTLARSRMKLGGMGLGTLPLGQIPDEGGGLDRRGQGEPLTGAARAVRQAGGEAAQPLEVRGRGLALLAGAA
jgi:hypothetical protein